MNRYLFLIICITSYCSLILCQKKNIYEDYALLKIIPRTEEDVNIVKNFHDPESVIEVLKRSYGVNDSLDLLVPSTKRSSIEKYVILNKLDGRVKAENYGRSFEMLDIDRGRRFYRSFNVYGYNSYTAIQEHIDSLASTHSDLMSVVLVGNSYQGKKMRLVKISSNPSARNPIIFIDAGIHAREWVAPAMAMYLINRLVVDPDSKNNELNGVDWYILPVVNPDGYEYTRSNRANRLWRKTRSQTKLYNCYGVDGNRNYGFKWGASGVSTNPCDKETYAGPKPFSEPETRLVKGIMYEYASRIKLYVSLHAYGQYLVYPWGYTGKILPSSWQKLDALARKVSRSVQLAGGLPFRVMSAGQWYPAAGGSDDFAFGAVGVPYSYTMELTDGYEFQYPESNLKTVLPQFYEGFKTFASEIAREFPAKSGAREKEHFYTVMEDQD